MTNRLIYIKGKPYYHYHTYISYPKLQKTVARIRRSHKTQYFILKTDSGYGVRLYHLYFNKVKPGWN